MAQNPSSGLAQLRAEIAAVAARMIAQDGADYDTARRKAARQILGTERFKPDQLPDNLQIEYEVRNYQAIFVDPGQTERVHKLRTTALQVMDALEQFHPYLTGSVLNGTAGEHDEIYLQLFAESAKEIEIFLLNKNLNIEISESPHFRGPRYDPVETASFMWRDEGVHAQLYELDDLRGALKPRSDGRLQRADAAAVRALMAEESSKLY
ncbi:hypothetical protein E4L96_02605 [Massilia arenosa]|uniref:Uncharacterized protein n=1 Tax=Zemynaea arenosa TaxID=2561931 RepID=A0A4Y9SP20_9BURK|nr:hypothetical protein [Massilia arenosa]TFW28358.1 hypothetical protein E4L96_02605 [Massilia arenosa]